GSHGLDPRLVIIQLPGHHEALRQWQKSSIDDAKMSQWLDRLRPALAEQLCTSTNWNLSESARELLMEAMTGVGDHSTGRLTAFLAELDRRLPPLRSGSREAVLVIPQEQGSLASTDSRWSMASLYARTMYQLPPRDPYLTGRDEQIQLIVNGIARVMAARTSAVAFLSGQPGVGTSTIAVEAARALSPQFTGGVLYFDLQGLEERARLTPQRVAAAILNAQDISRIPAIGRSNTWGSEGELYIAYATALREQQVLLVLDNALDASHVTPLRASRALSCCVIVTSRNRDQDFADPGLVFPIDVISRAASIELLSKIVRDRDGEIPKSEHFLPLCAELAQLCDDVPLALRLVAAQVSSRPEAEVIERL